MYVCLLIDEEGIPHYWANKPGKLDTRINVLFFQFVKSRCTLHAEECAMLSVYFY